MYHILCVRLTLVGLSLCNPTDYSAHTADELVGRGSIELILVSAASNNMKLNLLSEDTFTRSLKTYLFALC